MTDLGSLHVRAGEFFSALSFAVPRKVRKISTSRPTIVSLSYDEEARMLTISDARYGERKGAIVALGAWPVRVQVNGDLFRRLLEKYSPGTDMALMASSKEVVIVTEKSRHVLPRTDANGKAVEERPLPPGRQHQGKVEVSPDPAVKRVELSDTWRFSARVPMPQHREGKKRP